MTGDAEALVVGIDVGSTYTKAILLNQDRTVQSSLVRRTGYKPGTAATEAYQALVDQAGVTPEQVTYTAATGYGRYMVPVRHVAITELTCHGFATISHFPEVRTILDIGGQDIKAMRVDERGRVQAFRLNDKCAAGTGAFLEKTAYYLGLTTADIGPYAQRSNNPVEISSICAVFAEGEVISHLAAGVPAEDIVRGAIIALAGRAVQLVRRVGLQPGVALAGGMTQNAAMVAALAETMDTELALPPAGLGQLNGAYGAALLGLRRVEQLRGAGRPIPPPGTGDGADARPRRRWSNYVAKGPEPCSPGGCPVFVEMTKRRERVPS